MPGGVVWRVHGDVATILQPVPEDMRTFLSAPPGLSPPERLFYRGLTTAAAYVVSSVMAPLAGIPGRGAGGGTRFRLTYGQLRGLELALGPYSPSEHAARWRLDLGPEPQWPASPRN